MKKIFVIAMALTLCLSAFSQEKKTTVKAGDFSIGINVNPMTAFSEGKWQPADGAFAGAWSDRVGDTPKQMYILSKDPVASFKIRYHMTSDFALRAQLGITGSNINYKEYVADDQALYLNPDSQNKVVDVVTSKLTAGSLGLALEWIKGVKSLKFNAAAGLMLAIAGGSMDFSYGNPFNKDWNGNAPTTMPRTTFVAHTPNYNNLNDAYEDINIDGTTKVGDYKINYARPLKRFNAGYTTAVGLNVDMGVEWFFAGNMSLGVALTFTPIMVMFQSQTYTKYEAYTTAVLNGGTDLGSVIEFNKLVSPGSTGLLYGTDNFGLRLSLNYYL